MRSLLLALGLLLLATAGSAQASTLSVQSWSDGPFGTGNLSGGSLYVVYAAAPGERNDLTVSRSGSDVVFADPGAPISATWQHVPCTVSADAHTATCPSQGASVQLDISLGDGDDHAHVHPYLPTYSGTVARLDGGPGNDVLEADSGTIVGGDGNDTLSVTRAVGSTLQGGDGDDTVTGSSMTDLLSGGPGNDVVDGAGGNDSLYDGSPENPTDDGTDTLIGGDGNDQLYARGGVDTLRGGDGNDQIFADDALTAAGSPTAATPDTIDCGAGDDAGMMDAGDAMTSCETPHLSCDGLLALPWIVPVGPCPAPPVLTGTGIGGGRGTTTTPPASAPAAPAPSPPAPVVATPAPSQAKAPLAPLTVRLRLDQTHVRPPLASIPRALVTLSATADVTLTLTREAGAERIALPGTIARRIGTGERNLSLVVLLGGRQKFVPGLYAVTLTATASDGRTVTARAVLRMLTPKAAKRKPAKKKTAKKPAKRPASHKPAKRSLPAHLSPVPR